jgi:hypothetical protein
MYAGCVAGAIQKETYLAQIKEAGFGNITIQKEKPIEIPEDILAQYLNEAEIAEFNSDGTGIYSITVFAQKADRTEKKKVTMMGSDEAGFCEPGSGCC